MAGEPAARAEVAPPLPRLQIDIVGRGRLGRSLEVLWTARGHHVRCLGRGETATAELIVLAVPDREIAPVAASLRGGVVLHTSGSVDLAPLAHLDEHGSLHPLMTFPGPEVAIPDLVGAPAAVDGTPRARELATRLAIELGMRPVHVPGDRRLYHAAAVISGNFATTLLALAARALEAAGVSADEAPAMLAPLALQSLRNAAVDPVRALTGPVVRGDLPVLQGHREALAAAGLHDVLAVYEPLVAATAAMARARGPG
jgi:predicted short-subunit dehydrogenase-like oxidoreductase (DUF2520 family)